MATNTKNRFVNEFYEEYGFYPPESIDSWDDALNNFEGEEESEDDYEDVYSDLDGYDNYDIY